ncbi:thaumatin [Lentinula detonsa]|uniref:Thaumatin n=1 Tax=Lentinula detonsa TaxID=2804962 RepID=A0AA38PUS1_9AGAR|nr:thaumatin [Lentinula detonsa]
MIGVFSVISLLLASGANADRTFTVTNNCDYTVWPGMFTNLLVGTAVPDQANGWEQAAGATVSFTVPDNWTSGRIWGRTECDFTTVQGPTSCATGGCNGGLVCDASTGTGVPPATVAEWTLSGAQDLDYYDVSIVDGFNVPIAVTVSDTSCSTASCPANLNSDCPSDLQVLDSSGAVVGCNSACNANLDGDQADSANCCTGSHDTAATCPPSGVTDYDFFKDACPDSYVYAYDESSGTALWTCPDSASPGYTLTFCP